MPQAKLTVRIPEGLWIHAITTDYPEAVVRVISVLPDPNVAVGVLELTKSNPIPILSDIDAHEDVRDIELLWKHDETALLQVEAAGPSLLDPMQRAGVPVETPFEVEDGVVTWQLTTSAARLSALGDSLEESGIEYSIEHVRDLETGCAGERLTDRQLEVFLAAIDDGYYDVPREATLTDVASRLGVSKSTCSDVLHRAEAAITHWFAEEHVRLGRHGR